MIESIAIVIIAVSSLLTGLIYSLRKVKKCKSPCCEIDQVVSSEDAEQSTQKPMTGWEAFKCKLTPRRFSPRAVWASESNVEDKKDRELQEIEKE